jgi:hypothetical protein
MMTLLPMTLLPSVLVPLPPVAVRSLSLYLL